MTTPNKEELLEERKRMVNALGEAAIKGNEEEVEMEVLAPDGSVLQRRITRKTQKRNLRGIKDYLKALDMEIGQKDDAVQMRMFPGSEEAQQQLVELAQQMPPEEAVKLLSKAIIAGAVEAEVSDASAGTE